MMNVFVLMIFLIIGCSHSGSSAEGDGWFKRVLKEKWAKKQAAEPAPEVSKNVPDKIVTPGDYTFSLKSSDQLRYYKIHIPPQYKSSTAASLIVALHGGGGNMSIQAIDDHYKLISKSNKEGFIVAFPNGFSRFKSGKFATWNAGRCCALARDEKVNDVAFINEMVEKITQQINIDKSKIFAIGMSNGGMMSYRLACDSTKTFKAIASVTGTDNTIDCKPTKPISVLHIHAKDDPNVLFNGGQGEGSFQDKEKVTDFTSVPATIEKWVKLTGCPAKAQKTLQKDKAYCETYSPCRGQTKIQLCVTNEGGHSWPGGTKPRGHGESSNAIDATDVIWDFFTGL